MWNAFQRYRTLDPHSRRLFWRAAALLPLIAVLLRLRGFKKTRAVLRGRLSRSTSPDRKESDTWDAAEKSCRMVKAAARYGIMRASCLEASLALWYLLQEQNIPANLRIGVRRFDGKFEAHAWVEYEGAALNQDEDEHQHYAAFDSEFAELPGEKP